MDGSPNDVQINKLVEFTRDKRKENFDNLSNYKKISIKKYSVS